jgi:hypothetical protein
MNSARTILMALFATSLSACALGRSVVDIEPAPAATATNDAKAVAKITEVRDLRKFEASPRDPSSPSLGEESELSDPKITSRAFARKRGGFGNAAGDVVLPEGHTVADLVRAAAQRALQEKGYTVVDQSSPLYGNALPLAIDVEQFWAWFTPGVVEVTAEFKAAVTMKSDALTTSQPARATGYAKYGSVAVFESTWQHIVSTGLDDLTAKMKDGLKAPSELRPRVSENAR